MKAIAGVAVSILVVVAGVATYHWIAGADSPKRSAPLPIMNVGRTSTGQAVFTDRSAVGNAEDDPTMTIQQRSR